MDAQSIAPKPCRKCGSTERNYRGDCIPCKRAYAAKRYHILHPTRHIRDRRTEEERIAHMREYHRRYYEANKQRHKELGAKWAAENRERSREIKKRWADANKERMKADIADWRDRNYIRDLENKRRWNAQNADKKRILTTNRRNRLIGKLSPGIIDMLLERQNGLCACCAADLVWAGYHIDHIRPISKGGMNVDSNVQLLTPTCNLRKNAKWPMT